MRILHKAVCLAAALASGPAVAQSPVSGCGGPFPFPLSDGNRVAAKDMRRLFAGKTVEYIRHYQEEGIETPRGRTLPVRRERIFGLQWRADGSLLSTCEERTGTAESFKPCLGMTPNVPGSSDAGVWRIADQVLCWTQTRVRGSEEVCVTVHRQDGRYAAKLARGAWTCLEGEFLFK